MFVVKITVIFRGERRWGWLETTQGQLLVYINNVLFLDQVWLHEYPLCYHSVSSTFRIYALFWIYLTLQNKSLCNFLK